MLLGLIVEKISGMSLRQFVAENIFRPLRMDETAYYGAERNSENFELPITVQGYLKRSKTLDSIVKLDSSFRKVGADLVNTTKAAEKTDAAAGIVSTAADLLKFGRAFYDGKLLSPKSMRWFFSAGDGMKETPIGTSRQSITTIQRGTFGIYYASNGDSPSGINTTLVYHPETRIVAVVFTNIFGLFDEIDFINDKIIKEIISDRP